LATDRSTQVSVVVLMIGFVLITFFCVYVVFDERPQPQLESDTTLEDVGPRVVNEGLEGQPSITMHLKVSMENKEKETAIIHTIRLNE
jgi:hypothetical protein